jgi:NADH dehydrogenase (ubiquinone) 1 alpha/beta subcomplex 1
MWKSFLGRTLCSSYSPVLSRPRTQSSRSFNWFTSQLRFYSGPSPGLSYEEVTNRVIRVVSNFDKIAGSNKQVTPKSHFQNDLGLDSLDTVELVMQIEDEFALEIPDAEFEKIQSVEDAINYVSSHPHAK